MAIENLIGSEKYVMGPTVSDARAPLTHMSILLKVGILPSMSSYLEIYRDMVYSMRSGKNIS